VSEREPVWAVTIRALDLAVRAGLRLSITGLEHLPRQGPALLAANHVSYLDPVVLLVLGHRAGRKVRAMAVQEAFDKPVTGYLVRAGRHIPVGEGAKRLASMRLAKEALRRGDLVLVYPEGTIPRTDAVAQAKAGAGLLALDAHVPVIPIGSAGLERRRGGERVRPPAAVVIGPAVDLGGIEGRGRAVYEAASERILDEVRRLAAHAAVLARAS
jgi:1-acyl-sn-glycerol-3-phosphate acyltransferase